MSTAQEPITDLPDLDTKYSTCLLGRGIIHERSEGEKPNNTGHTLIKNDQKTA